MSTWEVQRFLLLIVSSKSELTEENLWRAKGTGLGMWKKIPFWLGSASTWKIECDMGRWRYVDFQQSEERGGVEQQG